VLVNEDGLPLHRTKIVKNLNLGGAFLTLGKQCESLSTELHVPLFEIEL